jgi:hypothetical protein
MTRVFLHVGAPKTGTTYLQDVLWANRATLARQGVLYPGHRPGAHFFAAQDLRGQYFRGHRRPQVDGAWERLARAAREWSGPVVLISHEILAGCDPEEAEKAVASLRPHEVHVVYTARDLARQIPAMWQESVKNGRVVPYGQYLQALQAERPRLVGRIFWRTQDAGEVLARWAAAVPPERIHVLTVPPRSAEQGLLWQRFCSVTGVGPHGIDSTGSASGNVSLGLPQAELLRRINERVRDDLSWPQHEALLKNFLTKDVLTRLGGERTGIPQTEHGWVRDAARRQVERLQREGYDVVGSLDELVPDFGDEADVPPDPAAEVVLDAAVETLALLLTEHVESDAQRLPGRLRGWGEVARVGADALRAEASLRVRRATRRHPRR